MFPIFTPIIIINSTCSTLVPTRVSYVTIQKQISTTRPITLQCRLILVRHDYRVDAYTRDLDSSIVNINFLIVQL